MRFDLSICSIRIVHRACVNVCRFISCRNRDVCACLCAALAAATTGFFTRARTQGGSTALIWAAINGHADCARLLLNAGVDKSVKDTVRRILYDCGC